MSWKKSDGLADWENKERAVFERMRKEADSKASEIAEKKVPKSMDISLLGGGFSFLLEFSTVIVLIFTLLILGILGSLEGQQIASSCLGRSDSSAAI